MRGGNRLRNEGPKSSGESDLPARLIDPAVRKEAADARVCDEVAQSLSSLLVGAPDVHPLYKDADARLGAFRAFVDRHASRLRRLPYQWGRSLDLSPWDPAFYPDLLLPRRPATPGDVAAGRAVFALPPPGGKPDDRPLPMTALLKVTGQPAEPVLILQSERDVDGKLHYGVLALHELRGATESEVSNVKPMGTEDEE